MTRRKAILKIIQIIPAKNVIEVYDGAEDGEHPEEFYEPVVAWGLTDAGEILPLVLDGDGCRLVADCINTNNVKCIRFDPTPVCYPKNWPSPRKA